MRTSGGNAWQSVRPDDLLSVAIIGRKKRQLWPLAVMSRVPQVQASTCSTIRNNCLTPANRKTGGGQTAFKLFGGGRKLSLSSVAAALAFRPSNAFEQHHKESGHRDAKNSHYKDHLKHGVTAHQRRPTRTNPQALHMRCDFGLSQKVFFSWHPQLPHLSRCELTPVRAISQSIWVPPTGLPLTVR